jgi:hypothetical protein
LLVCDNCYESKHPQLTPKNVRERISVPIARPDITTTLYSTTLASNASKDANSVEVSSASNCKKGVAVGITLDDGIEQWVLITAVASTTLTITPALWADAASGNAVQTNVGSSSNF